MLSFDQGFANLTPIARPDTQAQLARMGAAPTTGTTAEFGMFMAAETLKCAAVVKAAAIKIE